MNRFISDYFEPTENERKAKLDNYIFYDPETGRETCKICKTSYSTKNVNDGYRILLNHIEAKHVKIKAYPCHYCEKSFCSKVFTILLCPLPQCIG